MSKIESSMESLNDGLFDLFADANIFLQKKSAFFGYNSTFIHSKSVRALLEIF